MEQLLNQGIFEPKATPEQTAALERLETLLALIEGWVQTVVTDALGDRIPGASALSETLRRRRATGGPAEQTFATLVGLELRPRKLREAAVLWERLTQAVGVDARDAVWQHPDLLPSADDLDEPAGFIDRIIGGDTSGIDCAIDQAIAELDDGQADEDGRRTERPPRPVDNSRAVLRGVARRSMTRYALDPAMPVLLRPDGAVQVGWDPRRAVLVRPPRGLTAAALAALLRAMQTGATRRRAAGRWPPASTPRDGRSGRCAGRGRRGRDADRRTRRTRSASIRVHGRGPLSDLLVECAALLGCADQAQQPAARGASRQDHRPGGAVGLLVADPRLVRELHAAGVPHLPVRVRDGTGSGRPTGDARR